MLVLVVAGDLLVLVPVIAGVAVGFVSAGACC